MQGLDTQLLVALAASIIFWGLFSARLQRFDISAPMVFVGLGLLFANPLGMVDVSSRSEALHSLAELTLALLLFSDAARVNLRVLARDVGVPARLLFLGLPLSILVGTLVAELVFPSENIWVLAAIAAAVAPTDAALGAQVVEDPHVPARVRRILNVESGLNDGIATPFVTFFLAAALSELTAHPAQSVLGALGDLLFGALIGIAVGAGGGWLLKQAGARGWANPNYRALTVVAFALLAFAGADELGVNGFIAAFVGGLAFGTVFVRQERDAVLQFDAGMGSLLSLIVWFTFGAFLVSALDVVTWQSFLFAALALTVVRMLPVALVLVRSGLDKSTIAFVGWFGPRGLASVVFALVISDALTGKDAELALSVISLTVLASVVAHGLSARPFARVYGEHVGRLAHDRPEHREVPELRSRPLPGIRRPADQ
ncbi:MAG: cation:proton antiporter [Acidimicrobiia bacterium]